MQIIQLDHKSKALILKKDLIIRNDLVYEYFAKLSQDKRPEMLKKALYIGVLALIEDRIATFLANTKNELGTELERLKIMLELKTELFTKSAVKGKYAERDLLAVLNDFFDEKGWKDYAIFTGDNEGKLKRVKTGDILAFVDGKEDRTIILEVKFTKSLPLGDISETQLRENTSNIWGQLLEAKVNRGSLEAIIIFDRQIASELYDKLGPATYIPNVGYVTFVDTQSGNFLPLLSVYSIVRSAILNMGSIKVVKPALYRKIVEFVMKRAGDLLNIRKLVEANIKNNQKILANIETTLKELEISREYLEKIVADQFTTDDLLKFFTGKGMQKV